MNWEIVTQTHVGKVRQINEDSFLVNKEIPLMAVADGMGGMLAGEVASQIIAENLSAIAPLNTLSEIESALQLSLARSNDEIIEYSQNQLGGNTAGSTVVVLAVCGKRAVCFWSGDSRLYRVRSQAIEQLTSDHSQIAEMLAQGQISKEEAKTHRARNIITNAIGVRASLRMDRVDVDVLPGDIFLLCSDGLYTEVEDEEICRVLTENDVYRSSVRLSNLCLTRGARDNFTFIIGRVGTGRDALEDIEETLIDAGATQQIDLCDLSEL